MGLRGVTHVKRGRSLATFRRFRLRSLIPQSRQNRASVLPLAGINCFDMPFTSVGGAKGIKKQPGRPVIGICAELDFDFLGVASTEGKRIASFPWASTGPFTHYPRPACEPSPAAGMPFHRDFRGKINRFCNNLWNTLP